MAKRKHAAALFEVFHGSKQVDTRGASALRTPRWWFKNRQEEGSAESAVDPNDPTTRPIRSPLIAPRIAAVEADEPPTPFVEPAPPPSRAAARVVASPAPSPVVRRELQRVERDPVDPTRVRGWGRSEPHGLPRFELDHDHREVTIRLRLTTAAVIAFGVLLSLCLCYVIGRRSTPVYEASAAPAEQTTSLSSDELRKQPVQAGALDVSRHSAPHAASIAAPARAAADDSRSREREAVAPIANSVHGLSEVSTEAAAVVDGPRVIGMNYVIVQSYPDEQSAKEACDFLMKSKVSCSVEKAPPGWAISSNWYSVVSRRGFEHIHTSECESFKRLIERVGDKFASRGQFKRFAPAPYKWK